MTLHGVRNTVAGFAGAALLCAMPAIAQKGPVTPADKHFVIWAIETNNAEIAAAQLALQYTDADDVRKFAERMIHDHTELNEQMKPLALKLGISVAPGQTTHHQQLLAGRLKLLRGPAFDKVYIPAMVKGHAKAVKTIQHEIATTHSLLVKQGAERALPVIQEHLRLARKMAQDHHIEVKAQAPPGE